MMFKSIEKQHKEIDNRDPGNSFRIGFSNVHLQIVLEEKHNFFRFVNFPLSFLPRSTTNQSGITRIAIEKSHGELAEFWPIF